MGADNDAHYAECHIDTLEVGIADEAAYSKIVSHRRVIRSGRSIHHSNRLDELRNSSSDHSLLSSKLGKRRAKISEKTIFHIRDLNCGKNNLAGVKERRMLHEKKVFRKNLTVAQNKFPTQRKLRLSETLCIPPILLHTILRVSMS